MSNAKPTATKILSFYAALFLGTAPGCVPRERPEGDKDQPSHKAPRAAAVASRDEIPEDFSKVPKLDAAAKRHARSTATKAIAPAASSAATQAVPALGSATPLLQQAVGQQPAGGADPMLTASFRDEFARTVLGDDWHSTSNQWRIDGGKLCARGAKNHPLWLKRRLPKNARIEFTATSHSDDGDLKVEIWGDGRSAARGASYNDATGYLAIFGGWKNQFHVLARLDEHAPNRPEIKLSSQSEDPRAQSVENGTEYTFKVERTDGKTVRWLVDDIELFAFTDAAPLLGVGHDHFGFNNWQVRVCFDNLKITPLP